LLYSTNRNALRALARTEAGSAVGMKLGAHDFDWKGKMPAYGKTLKVEDV
jgi:hypothetical protein